MFQYPLKGLTFGGFIFLFLTKLFIMANKLFFYISIFLIFSCNENTEQVQEKEIPATNPKAETFEEHEREEMMKAAAQQPKENPYKDVTVEVKTFNDSIGWGYDVFINKSQYVHQPHIPAVSGNRGFNTEANAKKTGEFVAYKIKNNIMPPSVTPEELDSLGVLK